MARTLLAGVLAAATLGAVGSAAADQPTILRSARVVRHHLVLTLSVSDLRPALLAVAKRRTVNPNGTFLNGNVLLRESIDLPAAATGVVRWRSPQTLRAGAYFVQVEAIETGGVTDCPPKQMRCDLYWSHVRRVVSP